VSNHTLALTVELIRRCPSKLRWFGANDMKSCDLFQQDAHLHRFRRNPIQSNISVHCTAMSALLLYQTVVSSAVDSELHLLLHAPQCQKMS